MLDKVLVSKLQQILLSVCVSEISERVDSHQYEGDVPLFLLLLRVGQFDTLI
jgi:hypothetical protein